MKKSIVTLILFFLCNHSNAGVVFQPYIIDSSDRDICELTLNHYKDIYNSRSVRTAGFGASQKVIVPEFTVVQADGVQGAIKISESDFYGTTKLFVYHERFHSWRGQIYTGYIINPEDVDALKDQLKHKEKGSLTHFYPIGSLAHGSNFSWWENLPFKYRNKWYVLEDFGDFYRNDSKRNVYQIFVDGSSQSVCTLKIFQNFDTAKFSDTFPFFTAYKKAVEEIMLSPGDCGSSHPEVLAESNGRLFASMAIVRPWAVSPMWKDTENQRDAEIVAFQKKHFEDWRFQDVWSYREYETYQNLAFDAITELKNHYVANYSYAESDALRHASKVVNAMPGNYYSLGIYHDQNKDFSFLQKIMEGNYRNWAGLDQDLKLKYASVPLVSLSLLIDVPKQYENLPPGVEPKKITSFYNKNLLMFAAHMNNFDSVKYLVESGWPINNVTSYKPKRHCDVRMERLNRSALTYAAENGSVELIKLLVDAGSDTTIEDSEGNSLDYYIKLNPRFSADEKKLGFDGVLKKYENIEAATPSFSCKEGLNRVEEAICSSKGLSIYDRELGRLYKEVLRNENIASHLKSSQIGWIKRRNKECNVYSDHDKLAACLARTTRSRIRYLEYVRLAFGDLSK